MADSAPKVAEEERIEAPEVVDQKAQRLANQIRDSKHFIAFTGAGVSTSAGIPDFRGPEGAWTLRAQGRERTGKTVSTLQAIPTPTHMALAALQERGILKYLISQNCDGLHRKSGILSEKISELHGNSNREQCKDCGKEYIRDFRAVATYEKTVRDHRTGRKCARCGGPLHDTIINFGESLPAQALESAFDHAKKADLCLVLGSSLTVTPANEIPEVTGRNRKARLVICNLQSTPLDKLSDLRVFSKADDLMIQVMEKLQIPIPPFILRRRLTIKVETDNEIPQLNIGGVDEDGTPVSFLQSIKLAGSRRVLRSEPFIFSFRDGLETGTDIKLDLEFMGHYREPNLEIVHEYHHDSRGPTLYLLEYNPYTGGWTTTKQNDANHIANANEIIDLTDDTTILSDDLSNVAV
ncbi:DHS-like NAD/FAD-binding domain-containing protein [Hyaloscypha variabilis F]|uniref:protein acetyllysine N-acetyltransferase n=1 Tax=Hyaloscypha variabilis (strain UAMH 11265 / GT02V1 / F) TaxID=1149755 RepID=A0A2J6RJC8_HYAVF|nr:DHS-like NAD/FAD-binding domain-containing protein [Hyaloscypha variabilis F]